ncbi:hypothetical protein F5X99DRAFT_395523 [Biscogniauxia marginata]|nr:hypothetical protein F5X99DRAFT_395523 [Biscogniauxia marginata]
MATTYDFKKLNAAIDTTPIVDNHAHPLLKTESLNKLPLLAIATEANGAALDDTHYSLSHIRTVKHLAQILGCEQTWESVTSAIEQKRATSHDAWVKRCLQGIETILFDDGLHMKDDAEGYSWHDQFTKSKCKRIVRIEVVAEDIIARQCASASTSQGDAYLEYFMHEFQKEIEKSIADPEVVGFKSIICYRGGLDIPPMDEVGVTEPMKALRNIIHAHLSGERPFNLNKRLESTPLIHVILKIVAECISKDTAGHRKPIQFHTGLGDNDITLTKSSPSHLQTFIREFPSVPIVILHASYPWTREAAYLATVYTNVYLDIGEVFPMISRHGQENVVKQSLELSPWSKILWSTDGHWLPETYVLATTQVRSVLKTVLGELVRTQQLDEKQAVQLVQDILFNNSKKLYNLQLETLLPTYTQLSSVVPVTEMNQQMLLQKLRTLDAKYIRVYWHDYTSTAKCRLIPIKQVYKVIESGKPLTISITKASLGLLQNDTMIPQVTPSGVYSLHPDWSTLKPGPVDGHVSCYGEFRETDGSEEILCPRTILRKTVEKAASHGLAFLLGFEIEFVVLERMPNAKSGKRFGILHNNAHSWSTARALTDWGREGTFGAALDEILDSLDGAGISVEQFHPESAPGQFELILAPLPPLEACDALLHARQTLESIGARHGFRVTLYPKPFATACGSASHVHMSISSSPGGSGSGDGGDDTPPEIYESFYAGILSHLRAIAAFTYSSPASYERVVDHCWAGGRWLTWGTQNREVPLRKVEGSHWEVKALDGLANPYFAVAALLAAGTDGVLARTPLRWRDCIDDPATLGAARRAGLGIEEMFPADLREALAALEDDRELGELLHPAFVRRYIDVKTAELALLEPMSPEDRRRWLLERY